MDFIGKFDWCCSVAGGNLPYYLNILLMVPRLVIVDASESRLAMKVGLIGLVFWPFSESMFQSLVMSLALV